MFLLPLIGGQGHVMHAKDSNASNDECGESRQSTHQ